MVPKRNSTLFTPVKHKSTLVLSLALFAAIPNIFASLASENYSSQFTAVSSADPVAQGAHTLATRLKTALGNKKNQFLLGASTSEHQCNCANNGTQKCTDENCDWHRWATAQGLTQPSNKKYTCDWWNNYASYIKQLKVQFNLNAMRFSIEWALVQPNGPEHFDDAVLDHYADVFITMINNGITPIVCFHHYTSPCWFADMGGFEKRENAQLFAQYCARVYEHIMNTVTDKLRNKSVLAPENAYFRNNWYTLTDNNRHPLWATFNSPEGVAFKGYRNGEAPPALPEKTGLAWVSTVLCNMLEGHVQAYKHINAVHAEKFYIYDAAQKPKIGFLKNITQLDIANKTAKDSLLRPLSKTACLVGNNLQNECIYNFFTTGTFKATNASPLFNATGILVPYTNMAAPHSLDWIGVNYYSNQIISGSQRVQEENEDLKTDNANYRIYPHGLKRALKEINERIAQPVGALKNSNKQPIPIYVTENGIATTDHAKRNRFYESYLNKLVDALQHDGIPVYGYLTWTAFDNYEWPKTKNSDAHQSDSRVYGLTAVSADGKTLTAKEGARFYQYFVHQTLNA